MYKLPPRVATLRATTNAAPNTNNTVTLIAAPGAGKRLRIVGAVLAGDDASNVRSILTGPTSGTVGTVQAPGTPVLPIPFPGIQLADNERLDETDICVAAATKFLNLTVYYYIDNT